MCSDVQNCHHACTWDQKAFAFRLKKQLPDADWSMHESNTHHAPSHACTFHLHICHAHPAGQHVIVSMFHVPKCCKAANSTCVCENKDLNITTYRQRSHETVAHTTLQQLCCPDKENWLHSRGNDSEQVCCHTTLAWR